MICSYEELTIKQFSEINRVINSSETEQEKGIKILQILSSKSKEELLSLNDEELEKLVSNSSFIYNTPKLKSVLYLHSIKAMSVTNYCKMLQHKSILELCNAIGIDSNENSIIALSKLRSFIRFNLMLIRLRMLAMCLFSRSKNNSRVLLKLVQTLNKIKI